MKKLTRKTLDELAKILPVVSIEEQKECIGGGMDSCVFNFFDYLDGDRMTALGYYVHTTVSLGYVPDENGGVPISDIGKIGSFGGFDVEEVSSDAKFNPADGTLASDGSMVMGIFEKDGIGHAVLITGVVKDKNGDLELRYYDPTIGETDQTKEFSTFFSVKEKKGVSSGTTGQGGGSGNSNG